MGASLPIFLLLLLLLACRAAGETRVEELTVRTKDGVVEVRAQHAPLARVLDAVAAEAGAAVRYDGPRPSQPVSVSLFTRRPQDALTTLLVRARLKYALTVDPRTRRLRTLVVITDSDAAPPPRPTPEPTPVIGWRPDPVATIDEPPLVDHRVPPDR